MTSESRLNSQVAWLSTRKFQVEWKIGMGFATQVVKGRLVVRMKKRVKTNGKEEREVNENDNLHRRQKTVIAGLLRDSTNERNGQFELSD